MNPEQAGIELNELSGDSYNNNISIADEIPSTLTGNKIFSIVCYMTKESELKRLLPNYGRGFSFQTPHERRKWREKVDAKYSTPEIRLLTPPITEIYLIDFSDPMNPQTITHRINGQAPKLQP